MAAKFGANIRRFREARGWTQEKLAELLEMSPAYVSFLERGTKGKPTISTLRRLQKAFNCSADDLLKGVD